MTYFNFLLLFLLPPLLLLGSIYWLDNRQGRLLPIAFQTWSPWSVILAHVVVAIVYTTPWDNYLVATQVWWYDPALVTGIVLGWVPIEEYTFFVLQTIMTGLWLIFLMRHGQRWLVVSQTGTEAHDRGWGRWLAFALLFVVWIGSVIILASGWLPGTYLGLELVWALPPILFQIWFGGDILWRNRRLMAVGIGVPTLYLCIGDAIAIGAGTWTISPSQSTGIMVGNLPMEEIIFFLITNSLVILGMILVLAKASHNRVPEPLLQRIERLLHPGRSVGQSRGK